MKIIKKLLLLILTLLITYNGFAFANSYKDTLYYHIDKGGEEDGKLVNFYNILSNAVTDALIVNSARNGLGTSVPSGKKLETNGLYYQGVQFLSTFDYEFSRSLFYDYWNRNLPDIMFIAGGSFNEEFIDKYPDTSYKNLQRIKSAFSILFPNFPTFEFRDINSSHLEAMPLPLNKNFKKAFLDGVMYRASEMVRFEELTPGILPYEKIHGMLKAFTPFAFTGTVDLRGDFPYTSISLFLPPLYELKSDNFDNIDSWYLKKGLKSFKIPEKVYVNQAILTHLSYLNHNRTTGKEMMKVEIQKNLTTPNHLRLKTSFGRSGEKENGELLNFTEVNPDDSFIIRWHIESKIKENDPKVVKNLKKKFNENFKKYEIDARLHQITVDLYRKSKNDHVLDGESDNMFHPRFNILESKISFRVHRYTSSMRELSILNAIGFKCTDTEVLAGKSYCFKDFATFEDFISDFINNPPPQDNPSLGDYFEKFQRKLLTMFVRYITKTSVDISINDIEDAIDERLKSIFDDLLDRFKESRDKLSKKIHDRWFD